jgi:hypothetical protein
MSRLIVVTLTSEADAEAVKKAMLDLANRYGGVTLADYLELVGRTSSYVDEKVGWPLSEVVNIEIKQVSDDEFLLDLPEPKPVQ